MNLKNILTKATSTVATAVVLSAAIAIEAPKAEAASYKLFWEGDGGYTAMGMFSFSDDLIGTIVTEEELDDLIISFFDPEGTLLEAFDYDFPNPDTSGEFNFNFDTVTKTIFQSANFNDEDFGLDLGIDFGGGEITGLDFYTEIDGSEGVILDDGIVLLESLSDEEFELLDQGGVLTATKVPEPASILGLLAIGTLGAGLTRQKKQAK
ncbi:MAG: PEP-CTERM sorting domain-containing protein [Lyngbya sp.]|nr:PEP-CTERM sorting domain-containing protein [Lyngbya sp.]